MLCLHGWGLVLQGTAPPSASELGLDQPLPWNDKFHVLPDKHTPEGFMPEPPDGYQEALKRQQRLLHGVERRQSLRLHRVSNVSKSILHKIWNV